MDTPAGVNVVDEAFGLNGQNPSAVETAPTSSTNPNENVVDAAFNAVGATPSSPSPAGASATTTPATPLSPGQNVVDAAFGIAATPASPHTPSQSVTAVAPEDKNNVVDQAFAQASIAATSGLSSEERKQSSRPDPENNEEEPWYSKTWDWMNKPLWDLHQYGTRTGAGPFERGIESGAEDLVSGLTSPLSVALTVGTLGEATLTKLGMTGAADMFGAAPAAVLRTIGVSKEAAPYVARGVKALVDMGFTTQMLSGLMTQSPQFLDSLKDGDYENAARLGTNILAAGSLVALGARNTFEDAAYVKDAVTGKLKNTVDTLKAVKEIARQRDLDRAIASERAFALEKEFAQYAKTAGATEDAVRGGIVLNMEALGDRDLLNDQYNALAGTLSARTETPKEIAKRDLLYYATDKKNADIIRNSSVGKIARTVEYHDSPEAAIETAPLPASGDKDDLRVFAVPRAEVQAMESKPVAERRPIMPSHEIEIGDQGDPTGQVTPLRPDSANDITLDNARFNKEFTQAEKEKLLAQYKAATQLTPEQIDLSKRLGNFYASEFDRAAAAGKLRTAVEGYHPRAYLNTRPTGLFQNLFGASIDPEENPAYNNLRHQSDNGAFDTNVAAAKHRAFQTSFQADMAGFKRDIPGLAKAAANYQYHLDLALADQRFLDAIRASGAKASDGRPLVTLSGTSKIVGAESENPALFVYPQSVRGVQINTKIIKAMMERGELEELVNSGIIEKLPFNRNIDLGKGEKIPVPAYAWSTDGYQTIDHSSMRQWNYIGQDTDGNPAMMKANMVVHPEAADFVKQIVYPSSAIRDSKFGQAALSASREAKGSLLALSPFHAVQEGLRGAMLVLGSIGNTEAMKPWMDWNPAKLEGDPLLQRLVRNNLTLGSDYGAESEASEGLVSHSKLIGKIPGVNRLQDFIQRFTFDKLIPGLKVRAAKSVYYRFLKEMPGASADEVAQRASKYTNDAFGGQHWRDLGVSTNQQDIMRLSALAPDWLTSEARMLYRVAGGMDKAETKIARQDMLRFTAAVYMTARVLNLISSGNAHPEAPFGLVVPGQNGEDDKVYSVRTLPTDLIHVLSDPRGFIAGRLNPLTVRPVSEAIYGRNDRGQTVTPFEEAQDFARNIVPIGVQGLLKGSVPGGPTTADQIVKASGGMVYRYRTEAENLAQRISSDHAPGGPVSPEALAKHQQTLRLEDALRNGDITISEVFEGRSSHEAKEIIKASKLTPLQARFNHLPFSDALDVYAIATPSEKDQLTKLLWAKRVRYIKTHTPDERRDDPAWRKAQSIYGDLQSR